MLFAVEDVAVQLLRLAGGDPFEQVRRRSEEHQAEHGCGLHNAGGPVMQLVAAIVRASGASQLADLGCGIGYSTLWIAEAAGPGATVLAIDSDPAHITEAATLASHHGLGDRIEFKAGLVAEVLSRGTRRFDLVHDDAWFARAPAHLETMIRLLRPGGVLTTANWFLLVDALTGQPRNDWGAFAGPTWAEDTISYARALAEREDLTMTWITNPPVGVAVKSTNRR
jgi:predicted O-methyltransferase YrrM